MKMKNYDHRVKIDEESKTIIINRIMPDGSEHLYTSTKLPTGDAQDNREEFESFAKQLGENILLDSPAARKLLKL
ncbi:MAG: hypothetical protein OEL50_04620 [Rhodospirillaceae bacterium]|nr:hypothetical protein [Rhodospirillaceae bacterium]